MRTWLLVCLITLAGCATQEPAAPLDKTPLAEAPTPDMALLQIDLEWCFSVGALSIYPLDGYQSTIPLPEPLELLDIRGLVGDPQVVSANGAGWATANGPITGHWHVATDCDGVDWGFVGIAIEPPSFDDEPAPLNFLLAVWSWLGPLGDQVAPYGHATPATEVDVTLNAGFAGLVLDDAEHGRYEGVFVDALLGSHTDVGGPVRFWMLLPTEGHHNHHDQEGPFTPVSYDLAGELRIRHSDTDTTGVFAHTGTDHHAPLPGLGGNVLGVTLDIPDGSMITNGPRPAIQLNATWTH